MAVQNSFVKRQTNTGLTAYLTQDAVKKQINSVVGGKNGTRFISSIISAVQTTPALQECTNPSILSAALLGEALNLSPSPQLGQFYMVPFDNKKKGVKEAQFQLGYIMSIDLQTAIDKDMAVIHEDGGAEYVENEQEEENVVADQELNEVQEEAHPVDAAPSENVTEGQMSMEDAFFGAQS